MHEIIYHLEKWKLEALNVDFFINNYGK